MNEKNEQTGKMTTRQWIEFVVIVCGMIVVIVHMHGLTQIGFSNFGNPSAEEISFRTDGYSGAHVDWWILEGVNKGANFSITPDAWDGRWAARVEITNGSAYANGKNFSGWMAPVEFWCQGLTINVTGHYMSNITSYVYAIRFYHSPFTGRIEKEATLIGTLPPAKEYSAYSFGLVPKQGGYYICHAIKEKGWLIVDGYGLDNPEISILEAGLTF